MSSWPSWPGAQGCTHTGHGRLCCDTCMLTGNQFATTYSLTSMTAQKALILILQTVIFALVWGTWKTGQQIHGFGYIYFAGDPWTESTDRKQPSNRRISNQKTQDMNQTHQFVHTTSLEALSTSLLCYWRLMLCGRDPISRKTTHRNIIQLRLRQIHQPLFSMLSSASSPSPIIGAKFKPTAPQRPVDYSQNRIVRPPYLADRQEDRISYACCDCFWTVSCTNKVRMLQLIVVVVVPPQ